MAKVGCGIALAGVLLMAGSCAAFGVSIKRAVAARQVASIPIAVGEEITTDVMEVDTARLCQVALRVNVRSTSVQEDDELRFPDEKPEFEIRYDFPFRYSVLDADGDTVYSSSHHLAWNSGTQLISAKDVDATGGRVNVEHSFDKFKVSPPGRIRIRIEIEPDETYRAEAQQVMLNVYDNVSKQGSTVLGGFAMICMAPLLIGTGIIVFLIGVLSGGSRGEGERSAL
jgi:hypothetical protein